MRIRTESTGTFSGSITTTLKPEAIRLDKALFRLHPRAVRLTKGVRTVRRAEWLDSLRLGQ